MHKKVVLPTMIRQAKRWTSLLVCLLLLAGCGDGTDKASTAQSTGGLSFQLQFIDPPQEAPSRLSNAETDNICELYQIDEIDGKLSRIDGTVLASDTWPCEEHGGILDGVMPTTNLVLMIEGVVGVEDSDDGEVMWRGQKGGIEILSGQITPVGTVQMINITGDQIPPKILSITPADGAGDIPTNTAISVRFDEPVSAITLHGAFFITDGNSNSVSGTVTYEDDDDQQLWQARFVPAANLSPETLYTATLLTSVHDLAGNYITDEVTWSFTTGTDPLPPLIWGADGPQGQWGNAAWSKSTQ
jgi:hypothetical protein